MTKAVDVPWRFFCVGRGKGLMRKVTHATSSAEIAAVGLNFAIRAAECSIMVKASDKMGEIIP